MNLLKKFHHENWPTPVFYTPVAAYYLFTSLRLGKLNYFASVNPGMKTGGLCGFSKFDSFKGISDKYLPETVLIKAGSSLEAYKDLSYPRILKPDQGERGLLVSKVDSFNEVKSIVAKYPNIDFLLQEFVEYPLELGVFLIKEKSGWQISSITAKKFLSLTGDGFSTIKELALKDERARGFLHKLIDETKVLQKGETLLIEPIGNHSRGTEFVNACNHISADLIDAFKDFLDSLKGINYCRLDLKTATWNDLEDGNFKIMEINGVSAEPGHIYDPSMSLKDAYKDLFKHWKSMARIAEDNIEEGESFKETFSTVKSHMRKKKKILRNLKPKTKKQDVKLNFESIVKELKLEESPERMLDELIKRMPLENLKSFSKDTYNRVVLFEDDTCELVLCCWGAKQQTEKHHHDGRQCWFKCIEGTLSEKREMNNESQELTHFNAGEWGSINDSEGEHEMLNTTDLNTVSLHFYKEI